MLAGEELACIEEELATVFVLSALESDLHVLKRNLQWNLKIFIWVS
jgi:hypothetical protein